MNILLAADGSRFTKKALAFLVANEQFSGPGTQLLVLNVQPALPPHVTRQLGKGTVTEYHRENAEKVLQPIRRFLDRHGLAYRADWTSGSAPAEIVAAAVKAKAQLVVMGTHGHGLAGRIVMGSVAQRVVSESPVPVLLVK